MKPEWKPVATALLGSWPQQVAAWGGEALRAYVGELEARGVSPEDALVAIRSCPAEQKFPPSAPELAGLARRDPSRPTFAEMRALIFGPRGVLSARAPSKGSWEAGERDRADEQAMLDRASEMHPDVAAFVGRYLRWLRGLNLEHPEYGGVRVRELEQRWAEHVEAVEERGVAALAAPRWGELGRLDPLAALGVDRDRRAIGAGSES